MKKQYHVLIFLGATILAHTMQSAERIAAGILPVIALAEVWRDVDDAMDQSNVQKFLKLYDSKHSKQPSRTIYPQDYSRVRGKNLKQPRSR